MARYTAAGLLFEEGIIDSGDESMIEEDPQIPLPHAEDEEEHHGQPLPLSPHFSPHTADGYVQDEEELHSQPFPLSSHFTLSHTTDGIAQDELPHSQPVPLAPLPYSSSVHEVHNQPLSLAHVATTSNSDTYICTVNINIACQ